MGRYAWVTLATNDTYSLGALVLAYSLRQVGTKYELACMVTRGVTAVMREKLAAVFSFVQEVNILDSKDEANLALLARPELGITFTKLHCWRLTQYEKCVFVDADTFVVRNCDELFEREELSAAPDVGWPDCFNSGVFVFRPSEETFTSITAFAAAKGSFDGGDQGLLNMYFSDWATKDISKHLPFIYNMCSTAMYSYLPAFKQFGENVKIIHFIGSTKPWLQYFDTVTGIVQPPSGSEHLQPLLQLWWNIFCAHVHSQLSTSMATSTLAPIWHEFTPSSFRSVPKNSIYSDATNRGSHDDVFSLQMPDFSEFKDPWEDYSRNNPFPINNIAKADDKSGNCYCAAGYKPESNVASQPKYNQQLYYSQSYSEQYSSFAPAQTQHSQQQYVIRNEYNQSREQITFCSEEKHNHGYSVQHPQHNHWQQQSNEQRYYDEQHKHYNEQIHHDQRYHGQHHHHHEQHQHLEQMQRHDYHRDQANDYCIQQQPAHSHPSEVGIENHARHHDNDNHRASHQSTSYSHCAILQNSHIKGGKQILEAANTDTRRIGSLSPPPTPCTDLHNVATRSDPNVTEHLDSANAGIAGVLAQITLGEARSAEQIALEDHMRKQSWEQGQIDYLGRDSFDNIWKKICDTLSLAPRQPTPPKEEDTVTAKENIVSAESAPTPAPTSTSADVEVAKSTAEADPSQPLACKLSETKLPATQITEQKASMESVLEEAATKVSSESTQSATEGDVCARSTTESKDAKLPEATIEPAKTIMEQCKLVSLAVLQQATPEDKSLPLESKDQQQRDLQASMCPLADAVCKSVMQDVVLPIAQVDSTQPSTEAKPETPTSTVQTAVLPLIASIGTESPQQIIALPDVTQPLTIDPSEQHAEMLLAATEVSTISPVPIQVAESVLQAEPKESMSDVTLSDQAIATTVTAVHESTNIAAAPTTTEPVQLNGSACEIKERGDVVSVATVKSDAPVESTKQPASDVTTMKDTPSEAPLVTAEKIEFGSGEEATAKESSVTVEKSAESTATMEITQIAKTETAETKSVAEQVAKVKTKEEKSPKQEELAKAESTELIEPVKAEAVPAATVKSQSEVPESPIAEQTPSTAESIEAKELNIPSTPTVIEATPPISPLAESAQALEEKAAKKSLKKSDSTDGTEADGEDKKAKKTVKKTVKKPKTKSEETAASTAVTEAATATESSQSKTKKSAKVTKKTGLKTGQSVESDTNVPETPPPSSPASTTAPDVPVPPKRKTKSSTSGSSSSSSSVKGAIGKKSESEE